MSVGYFGRKIALSLLDTDNSLIMRIKMSEDCSIIQVVLIDGSEYQIHINHIKKGILDSLRENIK